MYRKKVRAHTHVSEKDERSQREKERKKESTVRRSKSRTFFSFFLPLEMKRKKRRNLSSPFFFLNREICPSHSFFLTGNCFVMWPIEFVQHVEQIFVFSSFLTGHFEIQIFTVASFHISQSTQQGEVLVEKTSPPTKQPTNHIIKSFKISLEKKIFSWVCVCVCICVCMCVIEFERIESTYIHIHTEVLLYLSHL